MLKRICMIITVALALAFTMLAQRPGGPPHPPEGGRPGEMPPRPGPPDGDWIRPHDTNNDGSLDAAEFQAAADRTFAELDRNGDGAISPDEMRPPRPPMPDASGDPRPGPDGKRILPPFFFRDRVDAQDTLSKAEFDRAVHRIFAEMDKNGDGILTADEARPKPPGHGPKPGSPPGPPPPPNARFIGAELSFGDKLIKDKPFSADIVIEDTRRLYDGSTAVKEITGAIYRDGAGRTRREQPLETIGGVNIVGSDNKPQKLVFINDISSKSQVFLDLNKKVARRGRMGDMQAPQPGQPADARTESLGTKTLEGVKVEGTRVTFQIPAGQIGNDKPMNVVTERWFSPDLQVLIMSRHVDPIAGEHVFKLVNIRFGEPAAELFAVPAGFRTENMENRSVTESLFVAANGIGLGAGG